MHINEVTAGDYLDAIEHAGARTVEEVAACLGQTKGRTLNELMALVDLKLVYMDEGEHGEDTQFYVRAQI